MVTAEQGVHARMENTREESLENIKEAPHHRARDMKIGMAAAYGESG